MSAVISYVGARFPINIPRVTLVYGSTSNGGYSPSRPHNGLDMSPYPGAYGEPIYAAWSGVVVATGDHDTAGNYVIYDVRFPFQLGTVTQDGTWEEFPPGTVFTVHNYHLQDIYVQPGQVIRVGDKIGANGSTGRSSGAHLHFEVRVKGRGKFRVDPMHFLISTIPGLHDELIFTRNSS